MAIKPETPRVQGSAEPTVMVGPPTRMRWLELCRVIHADKLCGPTYDRLSALYQEPHRSYHNFIHIAECLRERDRLRHVATHPFEVEMAIWFHDAVYDPRAHDNEEQSASLMRKSLAGWGTSPSFADNVERLILVTRTHRPKAGCWDEAVIADVDLAILGQNRARFDEYEALVRREYCEVPEETYRTGRSGVLEGFLRRERIYSTAEMFERYEQTARQNLQRSLERLRQP